MLRLFGFATLALVAICLAVSAAIALADDTVPVGGVTLPDPDRHVLDESPVSAEDVYQFDFVVQSDAEPSPEFDEPSLLLDI